MVLLDGSFFEDGTEELLARRQIPYKWVLPEHPRVEAMVRLIPDHTDADWVLRVDDDEFPSRALIHWIEAELGHLDTRVVGIPRRWVRRGKNGRCEFSNPPLLKKYRSEMDIQWRLFRPDRVDYISNIHSSGLRTPIGPLVPDEAFLVHFGWIVHSRQTREKKVANYDRQQSGAGSKFRDLYLWEDTDLSAHGFRPMETEEFDRLVCSGLDRNRRYDFHPDGNPQ